MKKARDLMTSPAHTIGSGETLRDALDFFTKFDVFSAPIVNPLGQVLGQLSEMGMIRASLKQFLNSSHTEKIAQHMELLDPPVSVHEDDELGTVFKAMMKSASHRVAVLNTQGKVCGVISPRDVLLYLAGENRKSQTLRDQLDTAKDQITKLQHQLDDAQTLVDRFHKLVLDTPYMMHSVDDNGYIVLANNKIHETLGYDPGELVGRSITDLYPESVRHEAIQGLKDIMEKGYHHMTYTTLLHKSGRKIRVDIASTALRDKHGKFLSTITISREINSEALLRALHGVMES